MKTNVNVKVSKDEFDALLQKMINTPPTPLKKLKGRKKRRPTANGRTVIQVEGVLLDSLQTEQGRQQAAEIFARNEDKLRPLLQTDDKEQAASSLGTFLPLSAADIPRSDNGLRDKKPHRTPKRRAS